MHQTIADFIRLVPFPGENRDDKEEHLERLEEILSGVVNDARQPLTDEEVEALLGLFSPDEGIVGAWTLLHLIGAVPGWPVEAYLQDGSNASIATLKQQIDNAQRFGLMC
jgi:hypothetical protein